MAECLDTSAAPLLNSEVAEFLRDKREARKESAATHPKPRAGHPVLAKHARWVESRVRYYIRHAPSGTTSASQAKMALSVLAGDVAAAEEAAKALLESDPSAEEGASLIRQCGRDAGGWGLTDAERLQLVNLRCVSAVDVCVAASEATYRERLSEDDVELCRQALKLLLPPPLHEMRGAAPAPQAAALEDASAQAALPAGDTSSRSVRFHDT